jgi:hypothetical protein
MKFRGQIGTGIYHDIPERLWNPRNEAVILGREWTELEANKTPSSTAKVMAVRDPNPDRNLLPLKTAGGIHATMDLYHGEKLTQRESVNSPSSYRKRISCFKSG